jgi:hypothetical protein
MTFESEGMSLQSFLDIHPGGVKVRPDFPGAHKFSDYNSSKRGQTR